MNSLEEIAFVFLSIMAVIWGGGTVPFPTWLMAVPAVFLLLNYWRANQENFRNLWKPGEWTGYYMLLGFAFMFFWTLIISISVKWNPEFWNHPPVFKKFATSILLYYGNALWQQALVNGYFLPRLEEGFKSEWKAILALGILFGLTHIPNPVLIPGTMIGGMLSAYFFKRTKNIYVLAVAHSILAVSIMYFFPDSWHHHLRIGPGYFNYQR